MIPSFRVFVTLPLLIAMAGVPLSFAKKKKKGSDEDGMTLEVSTKQKKKKGNEDQTQSLHPPKEAPSAVTADTDRLFFAVTPLSAKGLLSQQARDAMRSLLRTNHGTSIIKIRAFVAGSGDMRRIQEIAGEVFGAQHLPLPAISVAQAGLLPLEGAQVVIEGIGVDPKKSLNPNGLAFLSGQAAPTLEQSIEAFKTALSSAGLHAGDVLKVSCFVSSLEDSRTGRTALDATFPKAAVDLVQMQRGPVNPGAECEGVARLRTASTVPVKYSPQVVLVSAPKLIFSGTQLAFGTQENDVKLAFERLQRALTAVNARLDSLVMSHVYLTSMGMAEKVRTVRKTFYSADSPPASTLLPFEALPSLDASFGVDVVAIP